MAPLMFAGGWLLLGQIACSGQTVPPALRLPALLSDHMVLQAEKPARLWGWASPDCRVEVSVIDGQGHTVAQAATATGADAKWTLALPPLAAGTRGSIEIATSQKERKTVHDVLVGEVWLGSGQSNMGYSINADNAPPSVLRIAQAEARAAQGDIRYFAVTSLGAERPQTDVQGRWVVVGPDEVGACSAVAWNFGVILRQHLHRPIGLIVSAVGGTPAEAWIPKEALDATSVGPAIEQRNAAALAQTTPAAYQHYLTELERWKKQYPTRALQSGHRPPTEPYSPDFRMVPCRLYNGKIHGLEPYTLKGILWFQADGNERHPEEYGELIKTLITTWRQRWQDQLPFYYVEENNIHAYQSQPAEKTGLAFVRDAENAALELPDVDVATSVDLGLGSDAHFPNKKEVGRRLVGLALNNLYGQPGLVHSPQLAGYSIEGSRVAVRLKFADGLRTRNGEPLRGFAIRGDGVDWVWADGKIENQTILLWSDQVAKPTAVRYAWGANPVLSVENEAGLPLRPFRTDADPIIPYPRPEWESGSGGPPRFSVADFGAKGDGATDATPAIQAAIDAAGKSGAGSTVFFPAGHYRLGPGIRLPRTHLALRGLSGLALEGEAGTLLDSSDPNCAFFRIEDSSGISISGFQLDRHPFVFTQGIVTAASIPEQSLELAVDPGYDGLDSKYIAPLDFLMVFTDPSTGTWDHDAPWPPRLVRRERTADGHWRVALDRAPRANYVGKPFVLWANHYGGSAFAMDRSRDITVENVAYYGGGADGGFFVNHCEGRISFHRFSVAPPPGSGRRFSASGGAMVFNNRIQLVVDDCDFAATDDDGINMGGNSSHVLGQVGPRTIRIEGHRGDYRSGDRVALWDWRDKRVRTEARVERVEQGGDELRVTLDRDFQILRAGIGPWAEFQAKHIDTKTFAGREAMHAARRANETDGIDRIIDLDDVGSEIVRHSRFQSYRARNLLIKAQDALIENNLFHDTAMAAILAGPEFYWDEGPATRRLVIRNNRFENISGSSIFIGSHHSELSRDNRDIAIEDNTFVGYGHFPFGTSGRRGVPIYVRNADGVIIKNNRIEVPDPACPEAPRILVEASEHVQQSGNQLVSLPPSLIPPDLEAQHDVLMGHGGTTPLHAEIIQTRDAARRLGKAIIYVHGGGWMSGTNEYDVIRLFYLARKGYVLASVEYRLSGEARWPAQIEDCKLAVRWLRANASRFRIDPDHIGVYGHSAGGHLAACLGTMRDAKWEGAGEYPGVSSRVQAVVDASGPVDFRDDHFFAGSAFIPESQKEKDRGMMRTLLGAAWSQNPELYAEASPLDHVSAEAPPFFIVNGEKDAIVSPRQAAEFAAKLRQAGVPVQQLLIKNGIHGLGPAPGGSPTIPTAAEFQAEVAAFYAKYL